VLAHPNGTFLHYRVVQSLFGLYSVTVPVILILALELGLIAYGYHWCLSFTIRAGILLY